MDDDVGRAPPARGPAPSAVHAAPSLPGAHRHESSCMDGPDAATAAFEAGDDSASQFNREYSRLFGQPPMRMLGLFARQGLSRWSRSVASQALSDCGFRVSSRPYGTNPSGIWWQPGCPASAIGTSGHQAEFAEGSPPMR